MSNSLKRVERIRQIEENLARADLADQASRLKALEVECARAAADMHKCRNDSFVVIAATKSLETGPPGWFQEEANWQRAAACRKRAEEELPQQRVNSEMAIAEFMTRRRARQQASILCEFAEASRCSSNDRREQRMLDDWHRSRPLHRGKAALVARSAERNVDDRRRGF